MAHGWDQDALDALQTRRVAASTASGATISTSAKGSKHRNRKVVYKGLSFDSEKECARFQDLELLAHVGAIRDLRRQVSFDLFAPNGERICKYIADFCYFSLEHGREVIEDTKSAWTRRLPVYRIKCKWMAAQSQPISEV